MSDVQLEFLIEFNRNVIDEKVVSCHWVDQGTPCNDRVKGRDFKSHLYHRHGIISDTESYSCLWYECHNQPMKRTSLERHMKEQHVPVKWACPVPTCEHTFTRERTLKDHMARSHGPP